MAIIEKARNPGSRRGIAEPGGPRGFKNVAPLEEKSGKVYWAASTIMDTLLNAARQGYALEIRCAAAYGLSRSNVPFSRGLWMELKKQHEKLASENGRIIEPPAGSSEKGEYAVYLAIACLLAKSSNRWNPMFSAIPWEMDSALEHFREKELMDRIAKWGGSRAQAWANGFTFAFEAGRGNGDEQGRIVQQMAREFVGSQIQEFGINGLIALLNSSDEGMANIARKLPEGAHGFKNVSCVIEEAFLIAAKIDGLNDAIRVVSPISKEVRNTRFGEFAACSAGELLFRIEGIKHKIS